MRRHGNGIKLYRYHGGAFILVILVYLVLNILVRYHGYVEYTVNLYTPDIYTYTYIHSVYYTHISLHIHLL